MTISDDRFGDLGSTEEKPLTGGELDRWAADVFPDSRPIVAVVGGLNTAIVGTWRAETEAADDIGDAYVPSTEIAGFQPWDLMRHQRTSRAGEYLVEMAGPWLAHPLDLELVYQRQPPPLRLAVEGNVIPAEVLRRLLACPRVGSAVVPVSRPPGALRRRSMSWPFRVGVMDAKMASGLARALRNATTTSELLDVRDLRTDPGQVDLLIVREPPRLAYATVTERRPLANAVVCFGAGRGAWPVIDAELAMIRAASGAVASIMADIPADDVDEIARHTIEVVRLLHDGYPLDIAVTAGFDRRVIIAAEVASLVDATLPSVIQRRTRQLRHDYDVMGIVDPSDDLRAALPPLMRAEATVRDLQALPGRWRDAATIIPAEANSADSALDAATAPRLLQAYVGSVEPNVQHDNVIRAGDNAVDVFVGPREVGTLTGLALPEDQFFDDPAINHVTLTVVLAPLIPRGAPVRAELDVPRTGRSVNAPLIWNVAKEKGRAQARILLLYQNRVIQTGVLGGLIGKEAKLTHRLMLWQAMNHLDDRSRFDRTFVLNHDSTGRDAIVSHSDGTTTISSLPEIDATTERIRGYLLAATTKTLSEKKQREILINVAVEGNDLFGTLQDYLHNFQQAQRIQIVAARPGRFLPLEMIYDRVAPRADATLCANWMAASGCGPHCFSGDDDDSIVCPSVFWGLSRVIERHHAALTDATGSAFEVAAQPTRDRRTLTLTHAALAASTKVNGDDVKLTQQALGDASLATSWTTWVSALAKTPTDLLVLMPHSVPTSKELEISGTKLRNGRIERKHVTGGHQNAPIVALFGCDTGGFKDDPAGYVGRFMEKGASVVLSTLTMLLNSHAAQMSQRLAALLLAASRTRQPMGDLVAEFRREAVRAGLISALSVTAYGDADWVV